jgi:predicted Rossmann fold nucleotide-binding protein DprA/Smf involved in DNA uptake
VQRKNHQYLLACRQQAALWPHRGKWRADYPIPASNKPPSPAETGVLPALELSANEQKVYATLSQEELGIDEIIRKSGLPPSAVSVALLSLEMKRLLRQLPGKLFVRNR